jgi:hypothetical protein
MARVLSPAADIVPLLRGAAASSGGIFRGFDSRGLHLASARSVGRFRGRHDDPLPDSRTASANEPRPHRSGAAADRRSLVRSRGEIAGRAGS